MNLVKKLVCLLAVVVATVTTFGGILSEWYADHSNTVGLEAVYVGDEEVKIKNISGGYYKFKTANNAELVYTIYGWKLVLGHDEIFGNGIQSRGGNLIIELTAGAHVKVTPVKNDSPNSPFYGDYNTDAKLYGIHCTGGSLLIYGPGQLSVTHFATRGDSVFETRVGNGISCDGSEIKITGGSKVRVETMEANAIGGRDSSGNSLYGKLTIVGAVVETDGAVGAKGEIVIDKSIVNIVSANRAALASSEMISISDSACMFVANGNALYVDGLLQMDDSIVYAYSKNSNCVFSGYDANSHLGYGCVFGGGLYRFATNGGKDCAAIDSSSSHNNITVNEATIETCAPGGYGIYGIDSRLTMNSGLIRHRNSMDFKKDFFVGRELLDAYGLLISWNSVGIELGYEPEKILGVFLGETLVNWLQAQSIDNPEGKAIRNINSKITLNDGTIISDETEYGIYGESLFGGVIHVIKGGSLQGPISPIPVDAYGNQLACVTNAIPSGTAYERVTGGWQTKLHEDYNTSSLYLDGEKKLYLWVSPDIGFHKPDEWSSSFFVTSDSNGTKPMTTIKQGDAVYLKYAFKNLAGNAPMKGFFNSFTLNGSTSFTNSWEYSTLDGGEWGGKYWCPNELQNLPIGTYTLKCELDVTDKFKEVDEANNVKTITFTIGSSSVGGGGTGGGNGDGNGDDDSEGNDDSQGDADGEDSKIEWKEVEGGVEITRFSSKGYISFIPSTINEMPVVSIAKRAFVSCNFSGTLTIPDSVKNIKEYAFYDCGIFEDLVIPSSVTNIGDCAFYDCQFLDNVRIEGGVERIGQGAFACCSTLKGVSLPESVRDIGYSAFYGCRALSEITIPDGVTNIGGQAFYECKALKNITIPVGVKKINSSTFYACKCLESVAIGDDVDEIGASSFSGCESLGKFDIPSTVKKIGDYAFYGCKSLQDIVIPDSVTKIGLCAFYDCSSVQSLTIGKSVTHIAKEAFGGVCSLKYLSIPESVADIGKYAFWGCSSLLDIDVEKENPAYSSRDGMLFTKDGKTLIQGVNRRDIAIPSGTTCIGAYAFSLYNSIESVSFPGTVAKIENRAFEDCGSLRNIVIPDSVSEIGESAFSSCRSLTSADLPGALKKQVKSKYVFSDCSSRLKIKYRGLYEISGEIGGVVPESAASVYDGCIYDDDEVCGTIQVKISKPKNDTAKVTATIQILGEKKVSVKGNLDIESGNLEAVAKDGRKLSLEFGSNGMIGSFGDYVIDGARNLFSSKDKEEKADAEDAIAPWIGALNMKCDNGVLSVTIAKKGKVTIKGTYKGEKVSAKAQALIGEEMICIPVVYSKKTVNLAFTVWLSLDGGEAEVVGLDDAVIGKAGTLKSNAVFNIEGEIAFAENKIYGYSLLPNKLKVSVSGNKWVVADGVKAAKVGYKKGVGLTIAEGKKGAGIANASGLKLTYKSKDGSFTGSFTVYAIEKDKLKKHKATVSGVLINGVGHGTATIKKLGSWAITIE